MINRVLKTSRPLGAFLLGLGGTLLVLIAFWTGQDTRTELRALDMRFGVTDAPISDEILHVNIDDGSLEAVGRWPWPREKLAAIVDVLKDCGAKAVMIDLLLNEPQEIRYRASADEVYAGSDREVLSGDTPPQPVFDDAILATSLRRAENVFLATHIHMAEQASSTLDTYDKVSGFMSGKPNIDLGPVIIGIVGDSRDIKKAYLRQRAANDMERFAVNADSIGDMNIPSGRIIPPLVTFSKASEGVGCVTYLPDADKLVRRSPLLFKSDGKIYPQFATALAMSELANRHGGLEYVQADKSTMTIRCRDGAQRAIPLDSNGSMIVRWPREAIGNPTYGFEQIPAATIVNIWIENDRLRLNQARIQGARARFMDMGKALPEDDEIKKLYWKYSDEKLLNQFNEAYKKRIKAERQRQRTILYIPSQAPDPELPARLRRDEMELQKRREGIRASLTARLREPKNLTVFLGKPSQPETQATEDSPDQQAYLERMARATELIALEVELQQKNLEIRSNIKRLKADLRTIVADKFCMLGATGTGVPDFVPTPLGHKTPGVFVHSNIVNTILSGNFVYPADMLANTLTILLTGVLVSLLASTRPILQAAPLSLLAAAGYALFNVFVVFVWWSVWLAFVAPLGAMLVSFLFVTAFRQLTEERAKRRIRDRFAKSLSPALVEQLLTDPSLASPGGRQTELTCMFSDLAGFTPLSESLGPQETVKLLNRYFDIVTDIVQARCDGYLNKFLGDGLFVLFGVPITLEDHPSRAVDAALMCQVAVAELNDALASEMSGKVKLKVRIGIHGGQAMFGNCGSTEREDYTAIGDCVNLSARLESANKFFGTKIIVSEHTWNSCHRANLLVRPLGNVFITGVRNSLNILEVVGPIAEVEESRRKAVAYFAEAMELISNRKFADARTQLQQADELRPEDQATRIYMDVCEHCIEWGSEINAWPAEAMTSGGVVRLAWPKRT
jgi:class 3 adenylate cyclase/CHASE2 domain-containing sensor protein